jgi:NADH:ubiquinone oxidoreductase subunit 2 (subunit N)
VISLYYYLQVMREVFISKADDGAERLRVPLVMEGLALVLMIGVFYVGLYPQQLFDAADNAASLLFV